MIKLSNTVRLLVEALTDSPLVLSFVGGLLSSSLVWYSMGWRLQSSSSLSSSSDDYPKADKDKPNEDENIARQTAETTTSTPSGGDNGGGDSSPPNPNNNRRRPSLMDNLRKYTYSMDDIKHRIGELPPSLQRRSHWPWDRRRRRRNNNNESSLLSKAAAADNDDNDQQKADDIIQTKNVQLQDSGNNNNKKNGSAPATTTSSSSSPILTHKSDYCIGSIFGLDVGGTLAKLVYFEQKSINNNNSSCATTTVVVADDTTTASVRVVGSLRERNYRTAASAQAVLMARHGGGGSSGLHHLKQRQRSRSVDGADAATAAAAVAVAATAAYPERRSGQELRRHSIQQVYSSRRAHTTTTTHARHSLQTIKSNQDLEELNLWRQESVPDDLHIYAETVHTKIRLSEATNEDDDEERDEEEKLNNKNGLFRPKEQQQQPHISSSGSSNHAATTQTSTTGIRKSRSMLDLSPSWHRAEALDRFYNFARRLDSYREGLKDDKLSFYSRELGGEFHFIHFETRRMQQAMDLIRTNDLHLNIHEMGATGGGAHKFANQWKNDLGIAMRKQDELDSLVAGMQFVLSTVVGECYTFRPAKEASEKKTTKKSSSFDSIATNSSSVDSCLSSSSNLNNTGDDAVGAPLTDDAFEVESTDGFYPDDIFDAFDEEDKKDDEDKGKKRQKDRGSGDEWWWSRKVQRDAVTDAGTFPYLLVTIGTGVSVLRVDGPRKYERISGSTIGGGTYWGLIRLLTDVEDFEDVMRLAAKGDPSKVDMLVGDIYGENSDALEKIGLPASLVASSFGKLVAKEDPAAGLKQEDLARALLLMITNNIGQVAYLNAKLAKTRRIYFVGNFLRQNKISQRRISWAIDYWSKGEMEALFLEHEGYFGALGAFLLSQEIGQENESDRPHSPWGLRRAYSSFGGNDSAGTSDPPDKRPPHRRNTTLS